MPPERPESFPAEEPPSMPDGPVAIRQLVVEVRGLRGDIEKLSGRLDKFEARFDQVDELLKRFDKIETTLAKLVANYAVLLHEVETVKRGHVDHEQRLTKLEIRQNTKLRSVPKVVRRRK